MSYNIQLVVDEHGKVTIDEEHSYTNTAPRNSRIFISGHHVPADEIGTESIGVTLYKGDTGMEVELQCSSNKLIDNRPDGSDNA